jgi:tetratricopeptide (TPR) repeat protein
VGRVGLLRRRSGRSTAPEVQELKRQAQQTLAEGGLADVEAQAREQLAAHDDGQLSEVYLTAWYHRTLALGILGRHREAAEEYGALAEAGASAYGVTAAKVIAWRNGRATHLSFLGQYDHAESEHQLAMERAAKAQPSALRVRLQLSALSGVIYVHNMRGQFAKAESMARAAMRRAEKSVSATRDNLISLQNGLARSLNGQGWHAEAERAVQGWVSTRTQAILGVWLNLTAARLGLGRLDEAETDAREAVMVARLQGYGPAHYFSLDAATQLGLVLVRQGKLDEAERLLQPTAAAWTEHFGDRHQKTHAAWDALDEVSARR